MNGQAQALVDGSTSIRDRLMTTVLLAALLHAVVIVGVTFGGLPDERSTAPGLEVLLVSDDVPSARENPNARYLAQRTQLGAGADDGTNNTVPRPVAESLATDGAPDGDFTAAANGGLGQRPSERVLTSAAPQAEILYFAPPAQAAETRDMPLLVDGSSAQNRAGDTNPDDASLRGPQREELWTTPDTREAVLAPYLVAWRDKIERLGTLNFPVAARRHKASSNPVLEVAIAADGTLYEAKVRRSSGSLPLDQATLDILKLASPFDPFPKELAARYGVLRFAYEWRFEGITPGRGVLTAPADAE
ncbi:MAG: TonB family protein [Proteobacteria bacterium]|nr:TonB family protein [Pseudomonadota bacterium]